MKKVLFVDDDPFVLNAFQRLLRREFSVETALGPDKVLEALKADPGGYAVVVADMNMPGMTGLDLLLKLKTVAPDIVRIMLTGNVEQQTAVAAVNQGSVFRFLGKPCSNADLTSALRDAFREYDLAIAERELLENTLKGSLKALTEILSLMAPSVFHESQRMSSEMRKLADVIKTEKPWELEAAAMLCRIGYVAVPPDVLARSLAGQPMTANELAILERVPEFGHHLLAHIPKMESVARMILYQGKDFDGHGLPADGIAREDIPLGARLLRILAEVHRASPAEYLRSQANRYDPALVEVVLKNCLADAVGNMGVSIPRQPLAMKLKELVPRMKLAASVESRDGTMIVSGGHELTSAMIERLRNFAVTAGVKEPIYVVA